MKKTEWINVRLEPELYDLLKAHADRQDRSVSNAVRIAVREWIAEQERTESIFRELTGGGVA